MFTLNETEFKKALISAMPEILAQLINANGAQRINGAEIAPPAGAPKRRDDDKTPRAKPAARQEPTQAAEWPHTPMRDGSTIEDLAKRGTTKRKANERRNKDLGKEARQDARTATSARTATARAGSAKRAADAAHAPTEEMAEIAQTWFDMIDEQYENTPDGEKLIIDLDGHSDTFKALFINGLNKGMSALRAHNWAAKKAYPEAYIQY